MATDVTHETKERRRNAASRAIWFVIALVCVGLCLLLYSAVRMAREAALASNAKSPLNQLQLAFQNYHSVYGCFPPAYVVDDSGRPMHSWRALILPYIDSGNLYERYDFSEPWNGPKNNTLADQMPPMFHCPTEPASSTHTNYVVIVGPETAFPGAHSTSRDDFEDGLDNTILLAEIANSNIAWLEPRDLDVDTMSYVINDKSRPSISTSRSNGPYIVFADRIQTHTLTPFLSADVLRRLTTIKGHEPLFMVDARGSINGLMNPSADGATDADLVGFTKWADVHYLWLNRSLVTDVGLAELQKAANLSTVHLAHTAITDQGLEHFAGRNGFYQLDLTGTAVTDAGLLHLTGLVEMYYLNLADTRVTVPGVARLLQSLPETQIAFSLGSASARSLDLSGSSATNADLDLFRGLTGLSYVDLSRTKIDDAGLVTLESCSGIHWLDLSHTAITDNGLQRLRTLTGLTHLNLKGTQVTDAGIAELKQVLPELLAEK